MDAEKWPVPSLEILYSSECGFYSSECGFWVI